MDALFKGLRYHLGGAGGRVVVLTPKGVRDGMDGGGARAGALSANAATSPRCGPAGWRNGETLVGAHRYSDG